MKKTTTNSKGITLITLVITIIILLILAGIAIAQLKDGALFGKTQEAKEKAQNAQNDEQKQLDDLADILDNLGGGGSNPPSNKVIPQVGASVSYAPSGTYSWDTTLCQYTHDWEIPEDSVYTLSSAQGEYYRLTTWKVLEVNGNNVSIVPTSPTTGTVWFEGYNGYNNSVKMLNDACSHLYDADGNGTKISARSIKLEDFEKYMNPAALSAAKGEGYNAQKGPYSTNYYNYPAIYADELSSSLGMSAQNSLITENRKIFRNDLMPKNTYYSLGGADLENALDQTHYDLLLPSGFSTPSYWIATRSVDARDDICYFYLRKTYYDQILGGYLYNSSDYPVSDEARFFPVVTISLDLFEGDNTNGFTVNI